MPIQQAVHAFIAERLQTKLDGAKSQQERDELAEKYRPHCWIADAARRSSQIQFATYTVKGIHPDSKGTNVNAHPSALPEGLVGSASLNNRRLDVVGNAAALDVYKLLMLPIDGETRLLDLVEAEDERLLPILAEREEEARAHLAAFKAIGQRESSGAKTYELMKQLLWPEGDDAQHHDSYLNLVPLYPTSLVHQVYQSLQKIRFGEEVKPAKEARREKKSHPNGYTELPDVAYIKLGGTKPQNISQLNSERGGRNYLLPSLPPTFEYRSVRAPIYERSIFERAFPYFSRHCVQRFCLEIIDEARNNKRVRERRESILQEILGALMLYGERVRSLEGGWSQKAHHLNEAQALWLDPKRAQEDKEWAQRREAVNWRVELAHDFALWLNQQINRAYQNARLVYLATPEHQEWKTAALELMKADKRLGAGVFA